MKISIETEISAPLASVWSSWVTPDDITSWNFATEEWFCPRAEVNLEAGGKFSYRMEAKDGSMDFDFAGTFTKVVTKEVIQFDLEDNRTVTVEFIETASGVKVVETFDAEDQNSAYQQKQGWQCILENFKQHVESKNNYQGNARG